MVERCLRFGSRIEKKLQLICQLIFVIFKILLLLLLLLIFSTLGEKVKIIFFTATEAAGMSSDQFYG